MDGDSSRRRCGVCYGEIVGSMPFMILERFYVEKGGRGNDKKRNVKNE